MHNPRGNPRPIRVRWHADRPPMPLGCRWCGHPPYAHEAASLPHRAHHHWEQPTPSQVHARMTTRRRLGLSGRPTAHPVHRSLVPAAPTTSPEHLPISPSKRVPAAFPQLPPAPPSKRVPTASAERTPMSLPGHVEQHASHHVPATSAEQTPMSPSGQLFTPPPGRHRRPEQPGATPPVPYRRGRPPGTRTPSGKHTPYWQGASA